MKKTVAVACIAILGLLTSGCMKAEEVRAREEARQTQYLQSQANTVVGGIQYMKDPRTGLCFAYYWGGAGNGGPALTCIPCESIPPELLAVAEVKNKEE